MPGKPPPDPCEDCDCCCWVLHWPKTISNNQVQYTLQEYRQTKARRTIFVYHWHFSYSSKNPKYSANLNTWSDGSSYWETLKQRAPIEGTQEHPVYFRFCVNLNNFPRVQTYKEDTTRQPSFAHAHGTWQILPVDKIMISPLVLCAFVARI